MLKSFPNDRLQQIFVNGVVSHWIKVKRGVPRETILEQPLFNSYINDLRVNKAKRANIIQ